jgi:hypothetical protein
MVVGGLVGVFFGLSFGGAKVTWLDYVYAPMEREGGHEGADRPEGREAKKSQRRE